MVLQYACVDYVVCVNDKLE